MIAKPFIKWVGGKRALLPSILPLLRSAMTPSTIYHEPFIGGGAVFFALRSEGLARGAYIYDANAELAATYRGVRSCLDETIRALREHAQANSEAYYYSVRKLSPGHNAGMAALFIYRSKTGFNGLYRVSAKAGFNVPWGKYENPTIVDEVTLRAASAALQGCEIGQADFADSLSRVGSGDVVYLDPPYVPTGKTANFTGYTKAGFGPDKQAELAALLRVLDQRGARFVLSNADTIETRQLYDGWRIVETERSGRVSCKGDGRGRVGELIVTNIESAVGALGAA